MTTVSEIDGFDPLDADPAQANEEITAIFQKASKAIIHNILKSYTGTYDLFSEMIQNALDATQLKLRKCSNGYQPKLWITIDIPNSRVCVIDNGVGMNRDEFKYCLRPNVSFKGDEGLRGQKGVGATFLAYGYSFMKLQTKRNDSKFAAIMQQGRQWAEDSSGTVLRPKLKEVPFDVPELARLDTGTAVEIIVGNCQGERPKLAWISANTANQWTDLLRIKTPLGGIYLNAEKFQPSVTLTVVSPEGVKTTADNIKPEYYYPHDIPDLKIRDLKSLINALDAIPGDPQTKFKQLSSDFKRLDAMWEIWGKEDLLPDTSDFASAINEEDRSLIERHNVVVYGCFLSSAKTWVEFNDKVLQLRKGQKIIHGGLQLACDAMPQGDLMVIPLTSTIGYQANTHIIVHLTDGAPDMGRKTFQPEIKLLAEKLAIRAVTIFKRYLQHRNADTGAASIVPGRKLHEWKQNQDEYAKRNGLNFTYEERTLALIAKPQQEQDVIALFHELIGMGVLRGFKIYATSQNEQYDSLFYMNYQATDAGGIPTFPISPTLAHSTYL